jgi:hypothetical protein
MISDKFQIRINVKRLALNKPSDQSAVGGRPTKGRACCRELAKQHCTKKTKQKGIKLNDNYMQKVSAATKNKSS